MSDHNSGTLVQPPYPMLAKAGKLDDLKGAVQRGYVAEPKLDGIRCIAIVGDMGGVQLYNRQLRNITTSFPDVCEELRNACSSVALLGPLTLDGEIVVYGSDGEADFQLVQTRANRVRDVASTASMYNARYAAFDVLSSGRVDYKTMTYAQRRAILLEAAGQVAVPVYSQQQVDVLAQRQPGEGLMLKYSGSKYVPGYRNPAWLKVKWLHEVECVVGGVTWGIGKRQSYFGGLLVGVRLPADEGCRLRYIGTVGTGFNDATLESLTYKLHNLRTTANPFTERGTDWDLAYFVSPVLRVKVRFADYTRAGIMRFPRVVGVLDET